MGKNYQIFDVNTFYLYPGLVFGSVPGQGSYILADLVHGREEMIRKTDPFTRTQSETVAASGWLGRSLAAMRGMHLYALRIDIADLRQETLPESAILESLHDPAIQEDIRKYGLQKGLRPYVITETLTASRIEFASTDGTTARLKQVADSLAQRGESVELTRNKLILRLSNRLTIGYKASPVEFPQSSAAAVRVPAIALAMWMPAFAWEPQSGPNIATLTAHTVPGFQSFPLQPTHERELRDIFHSQTPKTYKEVFDMLHGLIDSAGIDDIRVFPTSSGFSIATRLEQTKDDGEPVAKALRFRTSPSAKTGKRRGFFIHVTASHDAFPTVPFKNTEDLFRMDNWNVPTLPRSAEKFILSPDSKVFVYVLEYGIAADGKEKLVTNAQCGSAAIDHLRQAGISK